MMQWFYSNKLSLNIGKIKFMIFNSNATANPIPPLKIAGTEIELVDSFKFLGISFDKSLDWTTHCNHVESKLISCKFLLNRVKNLLTTDIMKQLYCAHFYSHLTCGLYIWGLMIRDSNLKKLFKYQKSAVRIILNAKYNAYTDPIFTSLKCPKLRDIIMLELSKHV